MAKFSEVDSVKDQSVHPNFRLKYHYNTKKLHFLPKALFWAVVVTTSVENCPIFGLKYMFLMLQYLLSCA